MMVKGSLVRSLRVVMTGIAMSMAVASAGVRAHAANTTQVQVAAADKLFREAVTFAGKGDFLGATEKFQASYDLDPARGTLLGLAMAEERAGLIGSALGHYRDLAAQAGKAGDKKRKQQATKAIERLEPSVPDVTVSIAGETPNGLEVRLDGTALSSGAWHIALPLNPGEHKLEAEAPGYERFVHVVNVKKGAHETVQVKLVPLPKHRPTGSSTAHPSAASAENHGGDGLALVGYVTAGVGIVAAGAGTVLLIKSNSLYNDIEQACPDGHCSEDRQPDIDKGQSWQHWGNGLLIAGGLLTAAGVTAIVWPRSGNKDEPARAALVVSPASVRLQGTF